MSSPGRPAAFECVPLSPALGAEIRGVGLKAALAPPVVDALRAAWAAHGVLVFRGQTIGDTAQVRFARRFGPLERFRPDDGRGGLRPPEIFRSANIDENGRLLPPDHEQTALLKLNWLWHTDGCYRQTPIAGIVLRGVRVATIGGQTAFANLQAAYEALPQAKREGIEDALVRHSFEYLVRHQDVPALGEDELGLLPRAVHPLVRQHGDGRRSLMLSPPYMETVLGRDPAEAQALIDGLTDWATQERFVYLHHWRPGDVVMWDNAWTMHKVMPYPVERQPRVVHGVAILAFVPDR